MDKLSRGVTAARPVIIYRNELLPPSETFILAQAKALRRFRPVFAGIKTVPGLATDPYPRALLTDRASLMEKARQRAFLHCGWDLAFDRKLISARPELIHAHFAADACTVLPLARRLRLPLVVTLHGYDVTCDDASLSRWPATRVLLKRRQLLWAYASRFFCVSQHIRQQALERGFPEHKLDVLPVGIDLEAFSPKEAAAREKKILFVGRLVEKKGCVHLLHSMTHVQLQVPDAELIIVGDGPLLSSLKGEAARLGVRCTFLGQQTHRQVQLLMHEARVLAAPSIRARNGDAEGLPTVLCEAQAAGLPPVAFATAGVTEAIPPGRLPFLPKEKDEEALARELIRLSRDDMAWRQASVAGRRHIETYFDIGRQTRMLEESYDGVVRRFHA